MASGGTTFDDDEYRKVMALYNAHADGVVKYLLRDPSPNIRALDGGTQFLPGSAKWTLAAGGKSKLLALTGQMHDEYKTMENHYATSSAQVKDASGILTETNNEASKQAKPELPVARNQ